MYIDIMTEERQVIYKVSYFVFGHVISLQNNIFLLTKEKYGSKKTKITLIELTEFGNLIKTKELYIRKPVNKIIANFTIEGDEVIVGYRIKYYIHYKIIIVFLSAIH